MIPERLVFIRLFDDVLGVLVDIKDVGAGVPQIIPVLVAGLSVFVKIVVQCHIFSVNDGQPVSWGGGRSGFSDTSPTGSQLRVSPVQRSG